MKRNITNLPWYALHVRPRMEKVVARKLQAEGFEQFLPLCRNAGRSPDRTKVIDLPLFPGYVFCRFDAAEPLRVLNLPGVLTVAGVGHGPMPVEQHVIESLRTIMELGVTVEPWRYPEIGRPGMIESGGFAGVRGIMVRSVHRLVVSVPALQRCVAIEMDREGIQSSPPAQVVIRA